MREDIQAKVDRLYSLSAKELMREYIRLTGDSYYTNKRKSLIRRIAWLYQIKDEKPISQIAENRIKELAQTSKLRIRTPNKFMQKIPNKIQSRQTTLEPGTIITKDYNGNHFEVVVLDKGFMWNNTIYKSISGVAKAITGSHWNGKLFFGIK